MHYGNNIDRHRVLAQRCTATVTLRNREKKKTPLTCYPVRVWLAGPGAADWPSPCVERLHFRLLLKIRRKENARSWAAPRGQ